MIEAFVRDGQPFDLLGQQFCASLTEHVSVHAIEFRRVGVHEVVVLLHGRLGAEGSGHARRGLDPSWEGLGLAWLLGDVIVWVASLWCGVNVLLRLGSGGMMGMLVVLGGVEKGAEVGGWRAF